jgi:hypothetical protein
MKTAQVFLLLWIAFGIVRATRGESPQRFEGTGAGGGVVAGTDGANPPSDEATLGLSHGNTSTRLLKDEIKAAMWTEFDKRLRSVEADNSALKRSVEALNAELSGLWMAGIRSSDTLSPFRYYKSPVVVPGSIGAASIQPCRVIIAAAVPGLD